MRISTTQQQTPSLTELEELCIEEEIAAMVGDSMLLESDILYFSVGTSKIKEYLIKRDPSFSV